MIRVLITTSLSLQEELLDILAEDPEIVVADRSTGPGGDSEHSDASPDVLILEQTGDDEEHDGNVILLVDEEAPRPVASMGNGVRAVLPRSVDPHRLLAAIRAVAAGFLVSEPALRRPIPPSSSPLVEHLTPREHDVLQYLAAGLSNKEIAQKMSISEHTVKFHVAAILGKLGASGRAEAVAVAMRNGLLMI
jgi:DNA-binding NarL/FixJ family response regulator